MTADPLRALVEAVEALQEYQPHAQKHPHARRGFVVGMRKKRRTEEGDEWGHLHKGEVMALIEKHAAALSQAGAVEPEVPLCDNPSGLWCKQCRGCRELGIGMTHCSDPINCGNMEPMAHHDDCPHTKGDTGVEEADRLINRLMSSDPNYQDCSDAAALIRQYAMLAAAGAAAAEKCESGDPDCGPVAHYDAHGVPLCARCWDELPVASGSETDHE